MNTCEPALVGSLVLVMSYIILQEDHVMAFKQFDLTPDPNVK